MYLKTIPKHSNEKKQEKLKFQLLNKIRTFLTSEERRTLHKLKYKHSCLVTYLSTVSLTQMIKITEPEISNKYKLQYNNKNNNIIIIINMKQFLYTAQL